VNDIKWVNQFQPQTLVIATILLYIDAFFWLINLTRGFPAEVAGVAVVSMALGGWGIANEKKWGYGVAVFGALLNALWPLLYGLSLFYDPLRLLFSGALIALLLHPMSRDYQRIWFK
jgi:hypothetical protein